MKRPGTTDINKISNTRGHECFFCLGEDINVFLRTRPVPADTMCTGVCRLTLLLFRVVFVSHVFLYTCFIRLRESFGVPFPLRGGLHVIRLPCTRWDVSETCLHMFLPNQPKPAAGRPRNRKVHQPKHPPQGGIPGGAVAPHPRVSASQAAACKAEMQALSLENKREALEMQ